MTQIESPKRKMQKKNDYQRHKLFRKIKRRRKEQAEAEQQIAVKQLRKKLKLPKFDRGEDELSTYKKQVEMFNDANSDPTLPGRLVDRNRLTVNPETGDVIEVGGHVNLDPVIVTGKMPDNLKRIINKNIESVRLQDLLYKDRLSPVDPIGQFIVESAAIGKPLELAGKAVLYGIGRYGGKLGLNKLQGLARQKLLEKEFSLSNADKQLVKDIAYSKPGYDHELIISPSKKQNRLQLSQPTYQIYTGDKHKISEVIDDRVSELDWSPKSWFQKRADKKWTKQDEDALISHLQEYLDIEKKAKQNGTWLKNKDGSTFDGDPRSWVQMQSDSFKKNYNDEILTHGEDAINDLFGDFYGDGVGAGIGDKVLWTSTNKLLGKTYGNDIFSLAALKNAKTNVVADAEGRPWSNVVQGKDTNNLVYPNLTNDNIVRINNVVDVGPNIKWSEIKDFRKNEPVPEYLSRKYTGDDVVIGQDVSRKSIVGNNGDFNPIDKNIYRALIPLISTYGLYDINKYNYNSGKDIRIKPSKRGTFTKAAKQHGMSVQGFANRVLRNPSKYSTAMRKKANFAHNTAGWKH